MEYQSMQTDYLLMLFGLLIGSLLLLKLVFAIYDKMKKRD